MLYGQQMNASQLAVPQAISIDPGQPVARALGRNDLLSYLHAKEMGHLRSCLLEVELRRSAILFDADRPAEFVYFIEDGLVSLLARTVNDGSIELATVGRGAFIGLGAALGGARTLQRACVQVAGSAFRMAVPDLSRLISERPSVREHLLQYAQSMIVQQSRTAFCNAKHGTERKIARWLLLAQDCLDMDRIPVTHESLSQLLNARRPGVTNALSTLCRSGIIHGARGVIEIRRRDDLVERACPCYQMISETIGSRTGHAITRALGA